MFEKELHHLKGKSTLLNWSTRGKGYNGYVCSRTWNLWKGVDGNPTCGGRERANDQERVCELALKDDSLAMLGKVRDEKRHKGRETLRVR